MAGAGARCLSAGLAAGGARLAAGSAVSRMRTAAAGGGRRRAPALRIPPAAPASQARYATAPAAGPAGGGARGGGGGEAARNPAPAAAEERQQHGDGAEGPQHGQQQHEHLIEEVFQLLGAIAGEAPSALPRAAAAVLPEPVVRAGHTVWEAAASLLAAVCAAVEAVAAQLAAAVPQLGQVCGGSSPVRVPEEDELRDMGLLELIALAERAGAAGRARWRERADVLRALGELRTEQARGDAAGQRAELAALRSEVRELRRQQEELLLLLRKQRGLEQHQHARAAAAAAGPAQKQQPQREEAAPPPDPAALPPAAPAATEAPSPSRVPSSAGARAARLGGLVWRLAVDAGAKRWFGRPGAAGAVLSDRGVDMLVERLCHMRGAALKLGQMLSIQDEAVVPPHVLRAFERVRDHAHCMPEDQLRQVLEAELGRGWHGRVLRSVDMVPVAAASLGQVHRGELLDGTAVAVKVQFPGVDTSIASDVSNLRWLFTLGFMPKGLYADNILRELKAELLRECDYLGEADRQAAYAAKLEADPDRHGGLSRIRVPRVYAAASTRRVLITDWAPGVPADRLRGGEDPQRDLLGEQLFLLTLKETFEWRMMQTDPNFANFLWDSASGTLSLVDFGAARTFDAAFCEQYLLVVDGAARRDREQVLAASRKLGFLTGEECAEMLDAHCAATFAIGTPFAHRGVFDFAAFDLAAQVRPHVATMLRLRLTAPPKEIYSLHRRLSGLFLLLMKLGCRFDARRRWIDTLRVVAARSPGGATARLDLTY